MGIDHSQVHPDELASLYASGAMTLAEAEDFESHLDQGCEACRRSLDRMEPVASALLHSVHPVQPPARIRRQLVDSSEEATTTETYAMESHPQVWKEWSSDVPDQDILIPQATETGWEPTGIDGIAIRRLSVDRPRNQMTALIRMQPGTAYPGHVHGGAEECLVLEGDLWVGERHLHAGDYQRMAVGSEHPVQRTDEGCLLLIISSLTDELV